jgi:hypothetical protein
MVDVEDDLAAREQQGSRYQNQDDQDHDDPGKDQYTQANYSHRPDRYS